MVKKLVALFLALLLCFGCAAAQEGDVYDTAADAGKMCVRFLSLDTTNGEPAGDSTVLISPDGKVMLIDAGEPTAASVVVDALTRLGITKIDYLVASHPHIDHVGGMPAVLAAFEVDEVLTSAVDYPTNTNQNFLSAADSLNVPHKILSAGDSFSFGEQVRVDVLWPSASITYPADFPAGSTQFVNNLSLVLKFTFGTSTFLFSGDLYLLGEKEVVEAVGVETLHSDVAKVNHHGNETSSCKTWRSAVGAKYAVVTANGVNSIALCKKYIKDGSELYHTFVDGTVLLRTGGDGQYEVVTEKQRVSEF